MTMRVVLMYRGEAIAADAWRVSTEAQPMFTVSAGVLEPGVGARPCSGGVLAFTHYRVTRDDGAAGYGGGLSQTCVTIPGVRDVWNYGGTGPMSRPPEYHADHPQPIPLDTWVLFGVSNVIVSNPDDGNGIERSIVAYVMLSTERITPPEGQWELPSFATFREAYDAFGVP